MLSKPIKFQFINIKNLVLPPFALLLLIWLSPISASAESFKKSIEADLDFDGKVERIDLNGDREQTLQIRRGEKLLWQGVPARWKPWKIEIADVDGDGRREIIVGVFKATKFFPKPHNCLFIYEFSGETAFPKWLGSSLSRPFTDFIFADLNSEVAGDELVALETTLEGRKSLAVYHWNSFGYTLDWRRGEWRTAKILSAENKRISVEADGENIFLAKDEARSKR
jgi:hypothetical protein